MKQCPGKYCQSRLTLPRSCYFIVYSLCTLIRTWDDMYAVVLLLSLASPSLSLSLSLTLSFPPYTVYPLIAKSSNTPTHIFLCLSFSLFPTLVSLAHVFHLILPFLRLFLASLYSQLSIGSIPANYLQCHSHYFPISAANLLHTFFSPHSSRPISSQTASSSPELSVCL